MQDKKNVVFVSLLDFVISMPCLQSRCLSQYTFVQLVRFSCTGNRQEDWVGGRRLFLEATSLLWGQYTVRIFTLIS